MNKVIKYLTDRKIKRITLAILGVSNFFILIGFSLPGQFAEGFAVSIFVDIIGWIIVGEYTRCPNCHQPFALDIVGSQLVSEMLSYSRTRKAIIRNNVYPVKYYYEYEPVIRKRYLLHFRCTDCGFRTQRYFIERKKIYW